MSIQLIIEVLPISAVGDRFSAVYFFAGSLKLENFTFFINKIANICRKESYNLSLERKSNDLCNECNE